MPFAHDPSTSRMPLDDRGSSYRSVWNYLAEVEFEQAYVTVGGLRTRYVRAGRISDPPVLMLHGTGGHWEAFMANLGPLSAQFRCYAIDMVGCGFTDKPDVPYDIELYVNHVVAFLEQMELDRVHVCGVSLGSWVGAALALRRPDLVDRLVFVAPSGLLEMPVAAQAGIDVRRSSASDPSWTTIHTILSNLFLDDASTIDDLVAIRQRVYQHPDIETIMPRLLTLMEPDVRRRNLLTEDEWRRIEAPSLIIDAVDSPDMFLRTGQALAGLLPHRRSLELRGASHWGQFEQPEEFNRAVIDWFDGTTAPTD